MKNLIFITLASIILVSQSSCAKENNLCGANDQYGVFHPDDNCDGVTNDGNRYNNNGNTTINPVENTNDFFISQVDAMAAYTSYIDEKLMYEQVGSSARLTTDMYPVYFKFGGKSVLVAVSISQLKNLASKTVWPVQIATSKVFWTHDKAQSTVYYMN